MLIAPKHDTPAPLGAVESPPLQVLHIGPDMNGRGGIPAVIRTLMASPLASGHRFSFLRTYGSSSPGKRLLIFARGMLDLAAWCRRPGERLVHIHAATRGSWYRKAVATALVKALSRPVLLHFHAGAGDIRDFEQRLGPIRLGLIRWAFLQADEVIAVSAASAAEVQRIIGFDAVAVVPNAAPTIADDATGRPAEASPPAIVYLGGFANPAKGSEVLIEALPSVLAADPDVRILLAGPGEPTAAAEVLLRSPRVRWEGYLNADEKALALQEAQLFVMPSISEGMPVALLEAMAYGLAVVATRVGGIPEVATDGFDARLVEAGHSTVLALTLIELLADPDRRRELGRAARQRAEQLNDNEVFSPLEEIYGAIGAPGLLRPSFEPAPALAREAA